MDYISVEYRARMQRRLALLNDPSSGVSVYAVYATYRKEEPDKPYYVLARSCKEAKEHFTHRFDWLKIFRCEPLDLQEGIRVVTDVGRYIVI